MSGGKSSCVFSFDPHAFIHVISCAPSQGAAGKSGCYCLFSLGSHCVLQGRLEHAFGQCVWKHYLHGDDPVGLRSRRDWPLGFGRNHLNPFCMLGSECSRSPHRDPLSDFGVTTPPRH